VRLLWLLLLCAPVAAAPYVRWIDKKGEIHVDTLAEVLSESPSEVRVRDADGQAKTMPVARILELVREDDGKEEERALLEARRDVAAGLRLEAARSVLDHLAADGSAPWIRAYAAAARAMLAEVAREEDAAARLQRFLDDYPHSRFVSDAISAQARVKARALGDHLVKAVKLIDEAERRIEELEGPLALRHRSLRDVMERMVEFHPEDALMLVGPAYDETLGKAERAGDFGVYLLVEADMKWATLILRRHEADAEEKAGRPPWAALHEMQLVDERATLDLPEVRSDVKRELARMLVACGKRDAAREALLKAKELAPDPRRREMAETALKALDAK